MTTRVEAERITKMTYQTPELRYENPVEMDPDLSAPLKKTMNRIFEFITWSILVVLLAMWAVVGAIFWIPLMLRAMLRFSLSLLQSVFVGRRPDGAAKGLRDAVSFYRRGFVVAVEVVTKEELDEKAKDPETGNLLLMELLWAIPVWYVILFLLGWIQTSPADMWNGFASIQWSAVLGNVIDWIRA